MCGRIVVSTPDLATLIAEFEVQDPRLDVWVPRFNLAPSELAPVVTNEPKRALAAMRFGLVPASAKSPADAGKHMINARVETVATRGVFKYALARRRCIIPVTGYYEWQKIGGKKQPRFIHDVEGRPIPLAGIWERWISPDGEVLESFAIITRPSEGLLVEIHDRMPMEVPRSALDLWLDPAKHTPEELASILNASADTKHRIAEPVSIRVNSVANDDPQLIVPEETTERSRAAIGETPAPQRELGAKRRQR